MFLVLQWIALGAALSLSPNGFDPCGPEGPVDPGPLGAQRVIAGLATLVSVIHGGWRVRGWYLVPAVGCVGIAGLVWSILLRDPSSFDCGVPVAW